MSIFSYVFLKKNEWMDIFFISFALSLMFSISYLRFSGSDDSVIMTFVLFFIFIFVLFSSRLHFMKFIAYKNAFEVEMYQSFFDRFWFRSYDKLSYYENKVDKKRSSFQGIPMTILSVIIYILTLGYFIYPCMNAYKYKKIPHLFLGTKQRFEYQLPHIFNIEISDYRFSKMLIAGFAYYVFFAFFIRIISGDLETYNNWFTFILYWVAFVSLIPIFGSEGYELWSKNNFAWINVLVIMFLFLVALFVFQNIIYVILISILCSLVAIFALLWRKEMK